jgi:hypothetical protein
LSAEKFQGAELIDHHRRKKNNKIIVDCTIERKLTRNSLVRNESAGNQLLFSAKKNEKFQKSLSAIIINRHAAAVRCCESFKLELAAFSHSRVSVLHI